MNAAAGEVGHSLFTVPQRDELRKKTLSANQAKKRKQPLAQRNVPSSQGPLSSQWACSYRASTHTLSAEFSSTPATSVLSLTYCSPDFSPGTARNSSTYLLPRFFWISSR